MRSASIAIVGAGPIGLDLAYSLILAGHKVTLIARGNYDRLQKGFFHREPSHRLGTAAVSPSQYQLYRSPSEAGRQDYVFVCTGADDLGRVLAATKPLLHENTLLVSATNGLPAWFPACNSTLPLYTTGENDKRFMSLLKEFEMSRLIGGVIERGVLLETHFGRTIVTPRLGNTIVLGEPCGGRSNRVEEVCSLLPADCPLKFKPTSNLAFEIWKKLAFNIQVNTPAAMFLDSVSAVFKSLELTAIASGAVAELTRLGRVIGVIQPGDEARFDAELATLVQTYRDSKHLPSTINQIKARKPPELFPLVGAPLEFARTWNERVPLDGERINTLPLEVAGFALLFGWFHNGRHLRGSLERVEDMRYICPELLPELRDAFLYSGGKHFSDALKTDFREALHFLLGREPYRAPPCDCCFAYQYSRVVGHYIQSQIPAPQLEPSADAMLKIYGRLQHPCNVPLVLV